MTPHPAETPLPNKPSLFLSLPGELKNKIYRLVLVKEEGSKITISSTGYDRPALAASVSRQIRREANSIFYFENVFEVDLPQYSVDNMLKFIHVAKEFRGMGSGLNKKINLRTTMVDRTPNWDNLMEWMRQYHMQKVPTMLPTPQDVWKLGFTSIGAQKQIVIGGMANTVVVMRVVDWAVVESVLQNQRPLLGTLDPMWMQ